MAKRYSESDIRRQLAARQKRTAKGQFMPLESGQRLSDIRAATSAPSSAAAPAAPPPPIGLAEASGKNQQPSQLTVAASVLLREAKGLSIDAQFAETDEAKQIYEKIKVIRKLAERSADSAAITQKLDEIVKPVEDQLRKKASFSEYLKEQIQDFRKSLPERLLSKIPVVGGLLGGFARQRRQAQEQMGAYERQLTRKGAAVEGGVRASSITGILGGDGSTGATSKREEEFEASKFPTKTIEGIYKEIVSIRKMLEKMSKTVGKAGGGGGRGLLSSAMDMMDFMGGRRSRFGRTGFGRMLRRGRIAAKRLLRRVKGSRLGRMTGRAWNALKNSRVGRMASSVGRGISRAAGSVGRGISGAAGSVGRGIGRAASTVGRGIGSAASAVGRGAGSVASSLGSAASSAAGSAGGWLSGAWNWTKGAVSSLNPMNAIKDSVKSGAGKIVKGIVSLPGLGAAISAIMGIVEIMGIKNDPSLSAEEKKDKIGRSIVGTVGSAIGSVIGGAAGSLIPIPGIGTIIGTMGGAWVGETLAGLLADAIGGKGIYDMVASIPGIGSMISVDEGTTAPKTGAEGQTPEGAVDGTTATGTISAPSAPNTSVGAMANQVAAEQDAFQDATLSSASGPPSNPTVNNASIRSNVTNNINNFNDDLRIRNNDPTIRTMQAASHVF